MRPLLVKSRTKTLPWLGVCRGSAGSRTGRTAGSSGVEVYWQGPAVTTRSAADAALVDSRSPPADSAMATVSRTNRCGVLDTEGLLWSRVPGDPAVYGRSRTR